MTPRKISSISARIEACKKAGFVMEALLRNYHLNIEIIKYLLVRTNPAYSFANKKPKLIAREFLVEISVNPGLKSVITKKSFKQVKTWLTKTELFFKELRLEQPAGTRQLLNETEKIFALLNISTNKLFVRQKA